MNYPLIIAEIGINHSGSVRKAIKMVNDAHIAGATCVKFQCHMPDEMVPAAKNIIPSNAKESIWDIMKRCALSERSERNIKEYVENLGMTYLCTPFSRDAADRLEKMGVTMFKIGSGECNNYPLIKHIAEFEKPIILSTGMNDLATIDRAVESVGKCPLTLLHCTSIYPTPYDKVRLGAMFELRERYNVPVGLSDHSLGIYTALAAIALGATVIEKHFTSDKTWIGPDVPMSIDPVELCQLIEGSKAISEAMGGSKTILPEEQPTIDFAYACVVSIKDIKCGDVFTSENIWVKRPGNGEIEAAKYNIILGRKAKRDIPRDTQIKWSDVGELRFVSMDYLGRSSSVSVVILSI
jgi:sialic acid synthase SpsE